MHPQLVLYLLTYSLLPIVIGVFHFLRLRVAWAILFVVLGLLIGAQLLGYVPLYPKYMLTIENAFLAVLSIAAYRRLPLERNERVGHAILGTAATCLMAILIFDIANLRITGLSDDSTGLIVGIALSAMLFTSKSRKRR